MKVIVNVIPLFVVRTVYSCPRRGVQCPGADNYSSGPKPYRQCPFPDALNLQAVNESIPWSIAEDIKQMFNA